MNTFFTFTRREWIAAFTLWSVVLILFAIQYTIKPSQNAEGLTVLSSQFQNFKEQQQLITDSIQSVKSVQYTAYKNSVDTPRRRISDMYVIQKVELNSADTNDIMLIPQFGSKRANALVKYRNDLGGFHNWEQLH